jgi:predicted O-methyltransferase YrrM
MSSSVFLKIKNFQYIFKYYLNKRIFFLYLIFFLKFFFFSIYINFYNVSFLRQLHNEHNKKSFVNRVDSLIFTQFWFLKNVYFLKKFFEKKKLLKKKLNILEIGVFEGLSSIFFLKQFKKSKLYAVDTFKGSAEHSELNNLSHLKKRYISNTFLYKKNLKVFPFKSDIFFKKNTLKMFDLIHIDGDHHYKSILNDARNSFKILKKNGILIFDDYFWRFYREGLNPISAINLFLKEIEGKYIIEFVTTQIGIRKIT